jgi:hypothetical protein
MSGGVIATAVIIPVIAILVAQKEEQEQRGGTDP